jgi:hypothetical protein
MTVYFDDRWIGAHGIGRMATVFKEKIAGLEGIRLKGKPSHPLDSIYLTLS